MTEHTAFEPAGIIGTQLGGMHVSVWTDKAVHTAIVKDSTVAIMFKPLPVGTALYDAEAFAAQAAEIERLRGIVPEVLERLNDELCAENDALRAELRARDV